MQTVLVDINHANKMQSMSSKWHHFTMHNLNARDRVTVYF